MEELQVRILRLDPMRVATVHAFGESPELAAWDRLITWAQPRGLLDELGNQRIFGFNNPDPSPGSPNYGYEFWIEVGTDVQSDDVATVKDFAGGLYAVTRCKGAHTITDTWHRLATWLENSAYQFGEHQWLEGHVGPVVMPQNVEELVLDLYAPIAE
jgi:AraC family transcriptional regulator